MSTIGIPDNAFKALDGDDKKWVTSLRNQNKSEASGQTTLRAIATEVASYRSSIAAGLAELDQVDDASSSIVTEKERRYAELLASEAAVRAKAAADAWCAAFVAPKRPDTPSITDEIRRLLADGSPNVPAATRDLVTTLSDQSNFFHWDLAFADVFSERGGFDIVIGNPPWEMIQLDDREFFAVTRPDITDQPNMSARKRALASLQLEDPTLYGEYVRELRRMEGVQQFIHESGRFPLSSFGRLNTAPLFVELAISLLAPTGRCGLITPTGIATDSFNQYLFRKLVDDRRLASLYDFENGDLFPDVDSRFKFCLLTLAGRDRPVENAEFVFFAHQIEDLSLEDRRFTVSPEDFHLFNPNTGTCPIFRTRRDAAITRGIYERVPVLLDKTRAEGNPWQVSFQLMFMMNTDSKLFRTRSELLARGGTLEGNTFQVDGETYLPLYEGKMLHQFDHRAAHVVTSETAILRQGQSAELSLTEHADPNALPIPRYWVDARHVAEKFGDGASPHVLLAIRKVTSPTNERTVIGTLLPFAGVGDSAQVLLTNQSSARAYACLAACMSSFALDFTARAKLGGVNLNFFIMEQLPVLTPDAISGLTPWDLRCTLEDWFVPRVAELYCTAIDMYPLAVDLGYEHAPFRWDDDRRQLIRAEVDAAFFHLYGFTRDDAHYAMDTFPIIRRKDEQAYGEYQTQRLILERYDALAESSRVGEPYTTVLDPPPGDAKMASSFADAMIQ